MKTTWLLALIGVAAACAVGAAPAAALETPAQRALLTDTTTDTVLFEKDADVPAPPASMSKLMTLYMLFERLAEGGLSLDDTFAVSKKAWRMGGSKMFVRVDTRVSIEDLIRGIVVQSGNDASIVVAEGLSGTESAFAEEMTRRGRDHRPHRQRVHQRQRLAGAGPPDVVARPRAAGAAAGRGLSAGTTATSPKRASPTTRSARATAIRCSTGASAPTASRPGIRRGSGYGLVASAMREGRRLILVLGGLKSVNQRAREAERLLNWGFREFDNYRLFQAKEVVTDAVVWLGTAAAVPLVIDDDLVVTMTRRARRSMKVSVHYEGPLEAPVATGDQVAELRISIPDRADLKVPLFAGADVGQLGMFGRLWAAANYLVWGATP